jgi:CubicO group peptidase (beta-lactamase class C family)
VTRNITRREAARRVVLGGCGLASPFLAARLASGCARPPQSPVAGLEEVLERALRQHRVPGLAAAVVNGTGGIVSGVAGLRHWRRDSRIRRDDRFHIASCTKSWTATLAAILVEKQQLRWTTTLAQGLPSLHGRMRKEYAGVTLEQLLAHEGRLPAYTEPSPRRVAELHALTGTGAEQRLAFLAQVLTEKPNDATGDGAYSNAGYAAAGALIEQAAEVSWEVLIRQELAEPLGLTTVGYGYPATATTPDQPQGHSRHGDAMVVLPLDEARQLPVCLWPAGAIHCSIGDLARYAADHLNGLRGRPALMPAASYRHLHRQRGDSVFTLGWGIRREEGLGLTHFGAGSGGWFFARIVVLPERDAAVVLASNSGDAGPATRELWPMLVQRFATG